MNDKINFNAFFITLSVIAFYVFCVLYSQSKPTAFSSAPQKKEQNPIVYLFDKQQAMSELPISSGNYLAALHAIRKYDHARASDMLKPIILSDRNNYTLKEHAMMSMFVSGRYDNAFEIAEDLYKDELHSNIAGIIGTARYLNEDKYADAKQVIKALKENGGDNIIYDLLYAWVTLADKDFIGVKNALEDMKDNNELYNLSHSHKAIIAFLAGDFYLAERTFESSFDKMTRHSQHYLESMVAFYRQYGEREKADKAFEMLKNNFPESLYVKDLTLTKMPITNAKMGMADLLYSSASILSQSEYSTRSATLLRLCIFLDNNLDDAKLLLGDLLNKNGQQNEAIKAFELVKEGSTKYQKALEEISYILQETGDLAGSVQILKKLIANGDKESRLNPTMDLADLLRKQKKYEQAITEYNNALKIVEDTDLKHFKWVLLYSRGIAYENLKQWAKAEKDFLAALEIRPNQPDILNYLAYSWLERGENLQSAKDMLTIAHRKRPSDPHITDSVGWAWYKLGNYEKAANLLERASTLLPYDATVNIHLGDTYYALGQVLLAKYQWERALKSEGLNGKDREYLLDKLKKFN